MAPSFHTTARGHRIAYQYQPGDGPGIVFFCGFRSDMTSTKATALAEFCAAEGIAFTRFDYHGHGASEVAFLDFTIGGAIADGLEVLDHLTTGDQLLIGSSMGAWVALQVALERKAQVRGFIGVASAPDFTERLMYARMTPQQRVELDDAGQIWVHSDYTSSDYPITRNFIHEARQHVLLDDVIGLAIPMHLLHGQADMDVPWETSLLLAEKVISDTVAVTLIKDGDHRLNRAEDLALMMDAVRRMLAGATN